MNEKSHRVSSHRNEEFLYVRRPTGTSDGRLVSEKDKVINNEQKNAARARTHTHARVGISSA